MTEEEAIKTIEIAIAEVEWNYPMDYAIAFEKAIEALEKQIPKKPEFIADGYADGELVYDTWVCPSCGKHYEVYYDDYDFCPKCGQHIDRSEEE